MAIRKEYQAPEGRVTGSERTLIPTLRRISPVLFRTSQSFGLNPIRRRCIQRIAIARSIDSKNQEYAMRQKNATTVERTITKNGLTKTIFYTSPSTLQNISTNVELRS